MSYNYRWQAMSFDFICDWLYGCSLWRVIRVKINNANFSLPLLSNLTLVAPLVNNEVSFDIFLANTSFFLHVSWRVSVFPYH